MLIKDLTVHIPSVKGIIHVGGHDGGERHFYHSLNVPSVVWFEPNRDLFLRLVSNLIPYENQCAFNLGVHDSLKSAVLNVSSNDGESSSILPLGTHKFHHPKVHYVDKIRIKLVRLDEWFEKFGIDITKYNYLNIDVQGVELNVMKSLGKYIEGFNYIYTEVNEEPLYEGCCLINEIDEYLAQYGFERKITKMTHHKWGDALYVKK